MGSDLLNRREHRLGFYLFFTNYLGHLHLGHLHLHHGHHHGHLGHHLGHLHRSHSLRVHHHLHHHHVVLHHGLHFVKPIVASLVALFATMVVHLDIPVMEEGEDITVFVVKCLLAILNIFEIDPSLIGGVLKVLFKRDLENRAVGEESLVELFFSDRREEVHEMEVAIGLLLGQGSLPGSPTLFPVGSHLPLLKTHLIEGIQHTLPLFLFQILEANEGCRLFDGRVNLNAYLPHLSELSSHLP